MCWAFLLLTPQNIYIYCLALVIKFRLEWYCIMCYLNNLQVVLIKNCSFEGRLHRFVINRQVKTLFFSHLMKHLKNHKHDLEILWSEIVILSGNRWTKPKQQKGKSWSIMLEPITWTTVALEQHKFISASKLILSKENNCSFRTEVLYHLCSTHSKHIC